ncbi:MAG: ClC family H(+)/Cl(-) exchange transporter [Propionicimonas sp.]
MGLKFGAPADPLANRRTQVVFVGAAVVAAVGIGLVGGAFRWCLERAALLRDAVTVWSHTLGGPGWLLPVLMVAIGASLGQVFARLSPRASGSGIQDVEAVWREQEDLPGPSVLPSRFIGGLLAIGSGLVMGREGPSVHLGSTIGAEVGRWFRMSDYERKLLYTTVGGAGLAVAFNAPIGGAMFTIEEVTKSFRTRVALIMLVTTPIAVGVSRFIEPSRPEFLVAPQSVPELSALWVFLVFGMLTGPLGVVYNWLVMRLLRWADHSRIPPTARAAGIGGLIGLVLWFNPLMVGGGDAVTQLILSGAQFGLLPLLGIFVVRVLAGPLSYSTGAPGGLFTPLLAVGALWGALFHGVVILVGGQAAMDLIGDNPVPFVLVGMASMFTASVRAPLTGVILVVEMASTASLTTVLFAGAAGALFAASLMGAAPIYDSLRERMLARRATGEPAPIDPFGRPSDGLTTQS